MSLTPPVPFVPMYVRTPHGKDGGVGPRHRFDGYRYNIVALLIGRKEKEETMIHGLRAVLGSKAKERNKETRTPQAEVSAC